MTFWGLGGENDIGIAISSRREDEPILKSDNTTFILCFPLQSEKVSGLDQLVEELHYKNKQLEEEVADLRQTLATKEEAHDLHLRAYQDTHERQEEQLTLLETRVGKKGRLDIGPRLYLPPCPLCSLLTTRRSTWKLTRC